MVVSACLMVVSACLWWCLHVWCWHLPVCGGVCQVSACLMVVSAWYLPVQWWHLPVWWQCLSNVGDYLLFWSWRLPGILPVWLQRLPGSCLSDGSVFLVSGTLTRCLESLEGQADSPEEAKTTDALKQVCHHNLIVTLGPYSSLLVGSGSQNLNFTTAI